MRTPDTTSDASFCLRDATAQEMQLELIRRWQYNAFDGERVAAKLYECRDLWKAVMMDRLSISNPGRLPGMGLIKLRDLPNNEWKVFHMCWPLSDRSPKLISIDEQPDDQIVHPFRLGKANRPTH
jgi:hypothetical protein